MGLEPTQNKDSTEKQCISTNQNFDYLGFKQHFGSRYNHVISSSFLWWYCFLIMAPKATSDFEALRGAQRSVDTITASGIRERSTNSGPILDQLRVHGGNMQVQSLSFAQSPETFQALVYTVCAAISGNFAAFVLSMAAFLSDDQDLYSNSQKTIDR